LLFALTPNLIAGKSNKAYGHSLADSPAHEQNLAQEISPLPTTIRVRITGQVRCDTSLPYTVKVLNFYDYLRHVLPNEWLYTWDQESLRAGAVAAKMYAWYWIDHGGKWPDADVYDSACDQVYNPNLTRASTDQALQETWNWKLTQNGEIFQTSYLHICKSSRCLGQVESNRMAMNGYTWDELLAYYYPSSQLSPIDPPQHGFAMQFTKPDQLALGTGGLQIPLVENEVSRGVNIGAGDFTLEWWMKLKAGSSPVIATTCSGKTDWRRGMVIFDRSQVDGASRYGVAVIAGKLVVSVANRQWEQATLCGQILIADGRWHHLAIQRSAVSGQLWIFVDGTLDTSEIGPLGDISYSGGNDSSEADYLTSSSDRVLMIGASKADPQILQGWLDEIRFSDILRYSPDGFEPLQEFFKSDDSTTALYHLDEGYGRDISDSSGWSLTPSDGFRSNPSSSGGSKWVQSDLFTKFRTFLPNITVR
jgi:hypothetical protein